MTLKQILESNGLTLPEGFDPAPLETELGKMYKSEGGIPYERFQQKVREVQELNAKYAELEAKSNGYETKIAELSKSIETLKPLETEIAEIRKKEMNGLIAKNKTILEKLNIDKDNKDFSRIEKIKSKFIIKEDEQDYTQDELRKNAETFELLNETGFFASEEKPKLPGTPPKNPEGDNPKKLGSIASMITKKK